MVRFFFEKWVLVDVVDIVFFYGTKSLMVPFQIHWLHRRSAVCILRWCAWRRAGKLLAYLEKEFGKAQLGFQPLFLVVHGLQLVYSISKTLLQSRRTTINASSRAISIGCHWYLRIVDGGWRPYKIIWIHSTSIPLYPTVSHHIPLYPTMSQ